MKKLYAHIVNYEQGLGINGILTKYATKLEQHLVKLGVFVTVSEEPNPKADINHHINFLAYKPSGTIDTLMITHLSKDKNQTEKEKLAILKKGLKTAHGISMSPSLYEHLIKLGIPKKKLDYTTHAHDQLARRPRIIAMCTNLYPDGRKREDMFTELAKTIDKNEFVFRIIGKNWEKVLEPLVKEGLQAQWMPEFDLDLYQSLMNTSDYLLYTGDEDSLAQSVVDAMSCNLRVIAPNHKDLKVDIPFKTQKQLNAIFAEIAENPVKEWTWDNYAKKHLEIWEKLT